MPPKTNKDEKTPVGVTNTAAAGSQPPAVANDDKNLQQSAYVRLSAAACRGASTKFRAWVWRKNYADLVANPVPNQEIVFKILGPSLSDEEKWNKYHEGIQFYIKPLYTLMLLQDVFESAQEKFELAFDEATQSIIFKFYNKEAAQWLCDLYTADGSKTPVNFDHNSTKGFSVQFNKAELGKRIYEKLLSIIPHVTAAAARLNTTPRSPHIGSDSPLADGKKFQTQAVATSAGLPAIEAPPPPAVANDDKNLQQSAYVRLSAAACRGASQKFYAWRYKKSYADLVADPVPNQEIVFKILGPSLSHEEKWNKYQREMFYDASLLALMLLQDVFESAQEKFELAFDEATQNIIFKFYNQSAAQWLCGLHAFDNSGMLENFDHNSAKGFSVQLNKADLGKRMYDKLFILPRIAAAAARLDTTPRAPHIGSGSPLADGKKSQTQVVATSAGLPAIEAPPPAAASAHRPK